MAALITLAQYRYDDHMDGGWGVAMGVFMVVAVVALVALVVWLVRSSSTAHAPHAQPGQQLETPRQVLDRRLALGEVTPEEYQERVALLGG